MAFGVIAGANRGTGKQSFGNLDAGVIATTASDVTDNTFDQSYFGLYATASRGRIIATCNCGARRRISRCRIRGSVWMMLNWASKPSP